ncbi:MAG: hypothetical protein ACK4UK_03345 [Flavobacterium sp.]
MKNKIVLFILFVLPIVAYLFFSSGVHSFAKLPVLNEQTLTLPDWGVSDQDSLLSFENKITILGFSGKDTREHKGNAFNLNQKIYNKVREFKDFQLIMIAPKGTEDEIQDLKEELGRISDLSRWHYLFANDTSINEFYKALGLNETLDENVGSPFVYIIDKGGLLRGRKGKNKKGEEEYREGYNTISAADLHNEMGDDVKVILAEYRLALKKNTADRKK